MRRLIQLASLCFLLSLGACVLPDPVQEIIAVVDHAPRAQQVHRPLKMIMDSLGWAEEEVALEVDKSERRLHVSVKDSILKTYMVVLGHNPIGDKQFQGDKKTPEGTFTFRDKYPHKDWHRFIWVDYPNDESWKRFKQRKASGEIPADAKIGGEIGIHGVPEGSDDWIVQGADWTFGCIGMRNVDIDEIYPFIVAKKTLIVIKS